MSILHGEDSFFLAYNILEIFGSVDVKITPDYFSETKVHISHVQIHVISIAPYKENSIYAIAKIAFGYFNLVS